MVIRERVEVRPDSAVQAGGPATASAWAGGVRGRGTLRLRMSGAYLRAHPVASLTVTLTTTEGRAYTVPVAETPVRVEETVCVPTDEPWVPCVGRAYDESPVLEVRLGADERLDSLRIVGSGTDSARPVDISAPPYQDRNVLHRTLGCGHNYYVGNGGVHPSDCDCMAARMDEVHGSISFRWSFEPDPAEALLVTVTDTLNVEPGSPSSTEIAVQAQYADGTPAPLEDGTPLTFRADPTPFGSLRARNTRYPRPTLGRGTEWTTSYRFGSSVDYLADGVTEHEGPATTERPACDVPVGVTVSGGGVEGRAVIVIRGTSTAAGPDSLTVTVAPDSLAAGDRAAVRASARTADGCLPRDLSPDEPMAVSLSPPVVGTLAYGDERGTALTVPLRDLEAGRVQLVVEEEMPDAPPLAARGSGEQRDPPSPPPAENPRYDAHLAVVVSGGGLAGRDSVFVRGVGPGPDSFAVDLADPTVACGDSTQVLIRGLLGGEGRSIPDSTTVRLVAKDSTVSQLSWLVDGVRQSGVRLAVTAGALRDSSVWVRTQNCEDIDGPLVLRVCAEVDAYWSKDGVVSGEGEVTVQGGRDESHGLVIRVNGGALRPGEIATVSIEAVDPTQPLQDDDLVHLALDEYASKAGALRYGSQQGRELRGVPVAAFRAGAVVVAVNEHIGDGPPVAVVTDDGEYGGLDSSESAPSATDAPSFDANSFSLPTLAGRLSASLAADTSQTDAAGIQVVPFDVRFVVYPGTASLGQGILGGVTVVRAVDPRGSDIQRLLSAWYDVSLTPFVCAQGLVSEQPVAVHLPSFRPVAYGTTPDGLHECASLGASSTPGLVGLHTAEFAYPDEAADGAPERGYSATAYGGLATRSEGRWVWASVLPETSAGRLLVDEQSLTVSGDVRSPYACLRPQTQPVVTTERYPECQLPGLAGGHSSTGATVTLTQQMFEPNGGSVQYCVDEERDTWTAHLDGPVVHQGWSTCTPTIQATDGVVYIIEDEFDPQINAGNYRDIASRLEDLSEMYRFRQIGRGPYRPQASGSRAEP